MKCLYGVYYFSSSAFCMFTVNCINTSLSIILEDSKLILSTMLMRVIYSCSVV